MHDLTFLAQQKTYRIVASVSSTNPNESGSQFRCQIWVFLRNLEPQIPNRIPGNCPKWMYTDFFPITIAESMQSRIPL